MAQHYAFLLVEDFSHLAFANAVEPLRIANLVSGQDLYRWSYGSLDGEPARASNDSRTLVDYSFAQIPTCDQLFVLSGIDVKRHISAGLLNALRRERAKGVPIGALCSGAYALAQLGMLDGQKAAIHWEFHDAFMEEFPDVALVRNVFVADGPVLTASGGSATADLMLHLIERDHGYDLSVAVSDQMVYNAVRDASAEQRVSIQSQMGGRNPHLAHAIEMMRTHLEDTLSPADIARDIGISTRQLERLFGKFLNTSPKKYYMELRLERARLLLLQTEKSVLEVAIACGFESAGHFSRVYRTAFGVTPMAQRGRLA